MNTLIDHRESKFCICLVNGIVHTRCENCPIIRRYNGMSHIKVCTTESTVIVVSLTGFSNMNISELLRNNNIFKRIGGSGILLNHNIPVDNAVLNIKTVEIFLNLRIMRCLLRQVDFDFRLSSDAIIAKVVKCALSSADTGFLRLILTDKLSIILNGNRPLSDISGQAVPEETDPLVWIISSVIPEGPVVASFRPLTGTFRHDERGSILLCDRNGAYQLLDIRHLVFDDGVGQIHPFLTEGQSIVDRAPGINSLMIHIHVSLHHCLSNGERFENACS